jgi:hypothetical protein
VVDGDLPGEELAGELADAVGVDRVGGVLFGVWGALRAVEDVIRADLDQSRSEPQAGVAKVLDPDGVDREGPVRALLALGDVMEGSRVDDDIRSAGVQSLAQADGFADIDLADIERDTSRAKDLSQLPAQLTPGADDRDVHVTLPRVL